MGKGGRAAGTAKGRGEGAASSVRRSGSVAACGVRCLCRWHLRSNRAGAVFCSLLPLGVACRMEAGGGVLRAGPGQWRVSLQAHPWRSCC
jgi:hypothetical protein